MDSREGPAMRFVVGLGNPDRHYVRTRHNVGFRVLDELRRRWGLGEGRKAFAGRVDAARVDGPQGPVKVVLLEPHTYMNRSGQAVREMAAFHKADRNDLLVVLDDLALPPGRLRMRTGGSAGGHKGLGDVIAALGSDEVTRLRIGIGPPPPGMDAADFVLRPFRPDEIDVIEAALRRAADAVEDWVRNGPAYVMERYNPKD